VVYVFSPRHCGLDPQSSEQTQDWIPHHNGVTQRNHVIADLIRNPANKRKTEYQIRGKMIVLLNCHAVLSMSYQKRSRALRTQSKLMK
jgi:hypothetical protein